MVTSGLQSPDHLPGRHAGADRQVGSDRQIGGPQGWLAGPGVDHRQHAPAGDPSDEGDGSGSGRPYLGALHRRDVHTAVS